MKLHNDICNVQISVDRMYTVDSVDNKHYDFEYNPNNYKHSDIYTAFCIHIDLFDTDFKIALVGNFYSYDVDCAILNDNILIVMQWNSISQIDVKTGELLSSKKFECFGYIFGIYKISDGYIVYGEMEIVRLDLNFNKLWGFFGKDIFASVSGKNCFEISGDKIKLYDFEDNYYELDFNGNLIN